MYVYNSYRLKWDRLNFVSVNCSYYSSIYLPCIDLQCITRHSRRLELINIQWIQIFDILRIQENDLYIFTRANKNTAIGARYIFLDIYLRRDGNWTQTGITSDLVRTPVVRDKKFSELFFEKPFIDRHKSLNTSRWSFFSFARVDTLYFLYSQSKW